MILPPSDCPACKRNDQVQKVPAIHRNSSFTRMETQVTTSTSVTYDSAGNPTYNSVPQMTTVPVTHQTRLGALLLPPRRKTIPLPVVEKIILWLCPLLAIALYLSQLFFPSFMTGLLPADSSVASILLVILSICGLSIGLPVLLGVLTHRVFFRQANKHRRELQQQEQERWQYLMRQWEQFCYCHRCDCVFSASTEKIAAPAQIQQLYRQ
ncbi:hypothetical protein KSC_090430 [Ktedonobacter sp. SOSP1-52]|uniref:hypothetical protein n=1 Tax=Ktedonobacter sp. SOSP1-52 TaxID=2778366 RepID=UPI001915DD23|nr:hypothetical protein [Ktedonobacter sp. SOSP1-52]GHO70151.1 hypothetical protein KSC_090430 [Ktedonobacter sp. SOSP1-52]